MVIDEEADDASLNIKQKAQRGVGWILPGTEAERSRINRLISQILAQLEAGVYVGYTATPFANCFADAGDPDGFFPHAIQVLQAPSGYFGADRVFDELYDGPATDLLPRGAHIREVVSSSTDHTELDRALDDYIISGAVKLYRIERAERLGDERALQRLRHHTMMVHVGSQREGQRTLAEETRRRLFFRRGSGLAVASPGRTADRLEPRYEQEFRPISEELLGTRGRLPTPDLDARWIPDWVSLRPYVMRAVDRLLALDHNGKVVLLVNSDTNRETPDYESDVSWDAEGPRLGRWCVVVGGLMLSRGFTVEGLSTVYFRRVASAMDTQLQLARWNGYRSYFEDLIRLYFGVAEPSRSGSKVPQPTRNLYDEFEHSARMDARFRESLRRYSEDGVSPRIELPRFLEERSAASLPPTSMSKRRGVVADAGGPIEVGKGGTGISTGAAAIAELSAAWKAEGYSDQDVCPSCTPRGLAGRLRAAEGTIRTEELSAILEVMTKSTDSASDAEAIRAALAVPAWTVVAFGTVNPTPYGDLRLGTVDVPVRRRFSTDDPTLSTGEWNRWMRAKVGDRCRSDCQLNEVAGPPVLALIPHVFDDGSNSPVLVGGIIQIHGRSSADRALVAIPSGAATT
jgi:hypothetical protein